MTESKLPRSTCLAEGIDPAGVRAVIEGIDAQDLGAHSFILVRRGKVVAEAWWEPFRREDIHLLYSLSKSFTSTAVGLAIGEGYLSLDDKVISFFPDEAPNEISPNLAAMRVRDLLAMATGHETEPMRNWAEPSPKTWVHDFLEHPVPKTPGEHFLYNSMATYMCSVLVRKLTGEQVIDYLRPRLFDPLGVGEVTSENCPDGINVGGWGMSITTETIAKFGQLLLQDGVWNGKRLLPEGWVAQATSKQVSNGTDPENDWNQGYGFQYWRCRHNCFRGDGAFGQYCVVIPEHDAVVAITASSKDLGATLRLLWENLLPAFDRPASEPDDELAEICGSRRLTVEGDSVQGDYLAGSYADGDVVVRISYDSDIELAFDLGNGLQTIPVGIQDWARGDAILQWRVVPVASLARRQGDDLVIRVVETIGPFELTFRLTPEQGGVRLHVRRFGDFGPGEFPVRVLKKS